MEWLFAHPDAEPAAGVAAAGAGAGAAPPDTAAQDDAALTAMVAEALSVDGRRLALMEEVREVSGGRCLCGRPAGSSVVGSSDELAKIKILAQHGL